MSLSSYSQNTRVQVWTGRAWENGYVHENAHGIVRVAPLSSSTFPISRSRWVDVDLTMIGFIRLLPPTAPPTATATFPVNSWVEVLWRGTWYGAWIHSQQSNGTYTVQWNSVDPLGTNFKANEIRLNSNPQPASRPQIGGQRVTQTTTTTYPGVVYNTGVVGVAGLVNGVTTRVGIDAYTGLPVFY